MEFTSKSIRAMQKDTSTGLPKSLDQQMSSRIWLEVGHAYEPRLSASGRVMALDWRVWVRGVAGADISAFVDKVIFQLHPDTQFRIPKRIFQEPPYQIQESGSAPTEVHIDVFLKCCTKPERIQLRYRPLVTDSAQSGADSHCIHYDVQNPSEELSLALKKSKSTKTDSGSVLTVMPNGEVPSESQEKTKTTTLKTYEFIKPKNTRPSFKRKRTSLLKKCLKSEQSKADIKNWLRQECMPVLTESETEHMSQMVLGLGRHQKSRKALRLPPLSDPIFDMPELPPSLRGELDLYGAQTDYALL